nr:lysozyme-like protein [uncultured Mediterranean phage uvMED]
MPKIPTFTAEGSITQLEGTTTNIQMGLNNNLASALAPITKTIVEQKVKENALQNQTEALKLENDFITDMQSVTQTIKTDEKYATNKEAANIYLKEKSDQFIKKYRSLATNGNVQDKFSNYALAETQKAIFKTDTYISQQIVSSLNNEYVKAKENLLKTAYIDGGIDKETLPADLTKLAIDTFSSQVSPVALKKLVDSIPAEIQLYDGLADVQQKPRSTFFLLKDNKDYLPDLTYEQRQDLESKAVTILRQPLINSWNNVLAASAAGKDVPFFDMELAKEILPPMQVEQMQQKKYIIDTTVDNKKILFSAPNKDLENILAGFKEEAIAIAGEKEGQLIIQEYETALVTRSTALNNDPVKFIYSTNSKIEELNVQLNALEGEAQSQLKSEITEELINAQIALGVPEHKQRVMTTQEATNFVETYKLKSQENAAESQAMLASLRDNFGEFDSKALQELQAAGLPFTAVFAMTLANDIEAEKFFSFDSKVEQDKLKDWGKKNDIKFSDIEAEIATNSDLQEFENIIRRNNNIDSSQAISLMDNMQNVMAYYALNEMYTNTKFDQADAVESAANMFLKNFQIEETYFIPLKYDGKDLTEFGTTAGAVKDKAELIKEYYLEDFNAVAFKSTDPFNQGVSEQELSDKHKRMMRLHGEWRNKGDGTGLVFGVVLDGGQFATVVNADGKELSFNFNDTSYTLPGTDMQMDIKKLRVTDVPTEYEIGQIKGYTGFTINEGEAMVDKKIINNTSFSDKLVTRIKDNEGIGKQGLNTPYQLEYTVNGKKVKEDFYTVGHGHKLPKGAEIREYSNEEIENFFKEDMKAADKSVKKLIKVASTDREAYEILVEMAFQMGGEGLAGFKKTIAAINKGDYEEASKHMLYNYNANGTIKGKTLWHQQTGKRAKRLSDLMAQIK